MGNITEFERAVNWLSDNLTFDVDVRVNLFEVCLLKSLCHIKKLFSNNTVQNFPGIPFLARSFFSI